MVKGEAGFGHETVCLRGWGGFGGSIPLAHFDVGIHFVMGVTVRAGRDFERRL